MLLSAAEMDQNVLGTVDDSIDPNIFNFIDVGNSAVSPNLEDAVGFTWADDLISSAELDPSNNSDNSGQSLSQVAAAQQHVATAVQQHVLQGAVLQQQQNMGGLQLLAMGQQQQTQQIVSASDAVGISAHQVLQNQTILQGLGQQQIGSQFILKASPGGATSIHLTQSQGHLTQTSSGSTTINGAPSQFMSSSSPVISGPCTPSQSPGPHLSRTLTPNQTLSASGQPQIATISRPSSQQHIAGATVATATPSSINFLQLPQSQISQQMPIQGFVTNQTAQQNNLLQGHAVLASHGSNIVHTQNALIQNPNVVNVNVAHVLPNQLNLQGTLIQTAQGKFLIQTPAGGQQLPGQLNLSSLSNLGQVQVTGGVGLGQSLGQTTVMPQGSGSVALGSGNVSGQSPNFSLVNLGGPQGQQILIQRTPVSSTSMQATPTQTNLILRTVAPSPLLQQSTQHLQTTGSTTQTVNMTSAQVPQQLVTQTGATQNLQLQQLITGGGTQSLRLVSQAAPVAPQQTQVQTSVSGGVLLGQVMSGSQGVQQVRLIGQQTAPTSSKPSTVTLNLPSQNLNLQQLQSLGGIGSMQRLQLSQTFASPQQQFVIQQQQQPQTQVMSSSPAMAGSPVPNSLPASVQSLSVNSTSSTSTKKSKKINSPMTSSDCQTGGFDNILSQALITSGIEPDDSYMDVFGNVMLDGAMSTQVQTTPSPPPLQPPPPPQPAKKKKKKKKESSRDQEPVQPVVLSSTKDLPKFGITTASATPVTVTISQSGISLQGAAVQAGVLTSTHLAPNQTAVASNTTSVNVSALAATTAVGFAQKIGSTSNIGVGTGTVSATSGSSRGNKQGPPNVSVKPMVPNPQLSLAEKRTLLNIQTEITRLQNKGSLTETEHVQLQQLDMQRKKIVCQAQNQLQNAMISQKQQQQQNAAANQTSFRFSPTLVGQPLVGQPHLAGFQSSAQQLPQDLQSVDIKPTLNHVQSFSTPLSTAAVAANSLGAGALQIQPKSNAGLPSKLKLLQAKTEPGVKVVQGVPESDMETKPMLMAGGVQAGVGGHAATVVGRQMGAQTSAGGVVMAVSGQPTSMETSGSIVGGQPGVVHVHFGQSPQAVSGSGTIASQQVLLQSPHKVTVVTKGAATTVMTAAKVGAVIPQSSPSVQHVMAVTNLPPNEPRPVQIKIANQVMMLQLTPSQQEKLELHLSRMSLEQQQAFLQSQQHILAKLQRGTESTLQTQPQAQPSVQSASSTSMSGGAVVAPAVVGAASGDAGKKLQGGAVIPKQLENLPLTVQQALENGHAKPEGSQVAQNSGTTKRVAGQEIPKASLIHQQLSKDQANALAPDTKSEFKNSREACRRLLRYHVFQYSGPTHEDFEQADADSESISEDLIDKKDAMLAKYRLLLLQESMRGFPSSEMVFIQRMMNQDMHNILREEKRLIDKDPEMFVPMPMKYLIKKDPKEEEEEEEEKYDRDVNGDEEVDCESDAREEEDEEEEEEEEDADSRGKHNNSGDYLDSDHRPEDDDEDDENCAAYDSYETEDRCHSGAPSEQSDEQASSANTSHDDSFEAPLSTVKGELASPPPSSGPSPSAPARAVVKLVIRNDGKGFTSRLASERRKSAASESNHHTPRTRSKHNGKESSRETTVSSGACDVKVAEIKREIKKEGVDDCVYGTVISKDFKMEEKDRFSRTSLSVKLERLSEKTSQEYGIGVVNWTSSASNSRKRKQGTGFETTDTSRHKYQQHVPCDSSESNEVSSPHDSSSAKSKDLIHCAGGNNSSMSQYNTSSMNIGDVSDRVREMSEESRQGVLVECSDIQEHTQEDCDETGLRRKQYKSIGSSSERQAFVSHTEIDARKLHRRTNSCSSGSSSVSRVHVSVSSGSEMESAIDSIIDMEMDHHEAGQHNSDNVDLSDFGVHGQLQVDISSMQPPAFPGHIPPNLIETERMFNIGSDNEMEGSFESDGTDPQGSMMNAQMRHAINSILNSSGGSGEHGEGYSQCRGEAFGSLEGISAGYGGTATHGDMPDSQEECDESDDAGDGCIAGEERVGSVTAASEGMDDDLAAAVQSILM